MSSPVFSRSATVSVIVPGEKVPGSMGEEPVDGECGGDAFVAWAMSAAENQDIVCHPAIAVNGD